MHKTMLPQASLDIAEEIQDALPATGAVISVEGALLKVRKLKARFDEPGFYFVDFSSFCLPPAPFTRGVIPLPSRPELVEAIASALRCYVGRTGESKSTWIAARNSARTLVKLIEYGWMNGCYAFSDYSPQLMARLARELAEGGWARALRVHERAQAFIEKSALEDLRKHVRCSGPGTYHIRRTFARALGSNVLTSELATVRPLLLQALGYVEGPALQSRRNTAAALGGMARTSLQTTLGLINMLADIPVNPPLPFSPYPDYQALSRTLGRPASRTLSLRPEHVGRLMRESFLCINELSGPVLGVLSDIHDCFRALKAEGRPLTKAHRQEAMMGSRHRAAITEFCGRPLMTIDSNRSKGRTSSLRELINMLMAACFSVIATLNARRRDEIQHPSFGLHRNSLVEVDALLQLYECEFYIEKSHQCYVSFYVGDATVRAIRVLEQLSDLAEAFAALVRPDLHGPRGLRAQALFQIPNTYADTMTVKSQFFSFSTRNVSGMARQLLQQADGLDGVPLAPHMFRRAYALIFHYRYEDADLVALAQQLGHFNLEMTRTYVTDGADKVLGPNARSYGRMNEEQTRAWAREASELATAIGDVSTERLQELVDDVLAGKPRRSGGFVRLVQRFHQRNNRFLSYKNMDSHQQASILMESLQKRGHKFVPFKHGNCVAAELKHRSASCHSETSGNISRENAGVAVCGNCPYHVVSQAHVVWLERDAKRLEEQASNETSQPIERLRASTKRDNLLRWIAIHRARIGP